VTSSRIAFAELEDPSLKLIQKDSKLSVRRQCELLGISRSTLYYKPIPPDEDKRLWEESVMARLDYWHTKMPYLGSRKLAVQLQNEDGINVTRKVIRRLMAIMGIHAICPKKNLSKRNFKESIVPYRLRNKIVFIPNQVWSVDITFISMPRGHMYLTAIIDWCSRLIVGWNLSDTLDTFYVIEAVKEAIKNYGIPGIINSDQGSQFTSTDYKTFLREEGIVQSMDGKSRWADNIMIERWFRSLKVEELYPNEYTMPKVLRKAISDYIRQYNNERPHEALAYKKPADIFNGCFGANTTGTVDLGMAS